MEQTEQRRVLEDYLKTRGVEISATARMSHLGRKFSGYFPTIADAVNPERKSWTAGPIEALAEYVSCGGRGIDDASRHNVKRVSGAKAKKVSQTVVFLRSPEWRRLRYDILKRDGYFCQSCGARPGEVNAAGDNVRLEIDHIKPISKHWHLRLDPQNLQVLCRDCNKGKGAR